MDLTLEFKNLADGRITIDDVSFANKNGLTTSAERIGIGQLTLPAGTDTAVRATFRHVNDKKLFSDTGLPGMIDSIYTVTVFYTIAGKEGTRVMDLQSSMASKKYMAYREMHDAPVQVYTLKTSSGFEEKQKIFMVSTMKSPIPPFVHMTEQEVAMSGLNLKLKCFHMKDSLYTEIFAVNHSEMTTVIDTAEIEMIVDGLAARTSDTSVSLEKVTGSRDAPNILAKGDRIILKMRLKIEERPRKVVLPISKWMMLEGGRKLFSDDLEFMD